MQQQRECSRDCVVVGVETNSFCTATMDSAVDLKPHEAYNPHAKEASLRAESEAWDTSHIETASENDIPRIDISRYLDLVNNSNSSSDSESTDPLADEELVGLVEQLRYASSHVGFYYLVGHGISVHQMERIFVAARSFFDLPAAEKEALLMDRPDWPHRGMGYLPLHHRKLPTRQRGNLNEAFVIKRQQSNKIPTVALRDDNQWPDERRLPGFFREVQSYASALERLAKNLLPLYARALDVDDPHYFDGAFTCPTYRLRMTRYPPPAAVASSGGSRTDGDAFGIAPHVDTSFITILAQDSDGLVIYSETKQCWLRAPAVEGALIVNTGELLHQWSNDRFVSVKHFANNNNNNNERYSIPFFFNADADYRMQCIPTCTWLPDNPPRYPPFSYSESQAVVQGE